MYLYEFQSNGSNFWEENQFCNSVTFKLSPFFELRYMYDGIINGICCRYFYPYIYVFAADKYRRYAPNISILSEKGKILKDFPNVTLLQLAIFQTVFWLFGYRLTLNVSQNMVLVATYLYKITQKLFAALQEPIFLEYFFKVWMSHCYKSFVRKWYKITILIITFLFVNGFQV